MHSREDVIAGSRPQGALEVSSGKERDEQNTENRPLSLQVLPNHLTGGTTPVNLYEEPTYQLEG